MFKKLAFGCLLIFIAVGAGIYTVWQRSSDLPDWYTESAPVSSEAGSEPVSSTPSGGSSGSFAPPPEATPGRAAPGRAAPGRAAPPPALPRLTAGRLELDEPQLNALIERELADHPRGRRLREAVKGVRATIDGDRLEVGVVANLDDLAKATEGGREAEVIRRLSSVAPWLGKRDFHLAVRGRPQARNGRLVLGRDTEVVIGGIPFPAAELASRLGVSDQELDRGLEMPISGWTIQDVEVAGDALALSVAER